MWMIHTQHQESKPTTTLMFSPLKSVPSSLNAYTVVAVVFGDSVITLEGDMA